MRDLAGWISRGKASQTEGTASTRVQRRAWWKWSERVGGDESGEVTGSNIPCGR